MIIYGELTFRSWRRKVQVMIEGPGHIALNEIAGNMMLEKRLYHAKGIADVRKWDDGMSHARRDLNWQKMFDLAIDSERAIYYLESSKPEDLEPCTMCGKMCAVRNMNLALAGKEIDL